MEVLITAAGLLKWSYGNWEMTGNDLLIPGVSGRTFSTDKKPV